MKLLNRIMNLITICALMLTFVFTCKTAYILWNSGRRYQCFSKIHQDWTTQYNLWLSRMDFSQTLPEPFKTSIFNKACIEFKEFEEKQDIDMKNCPNF